MDELPQGFITADFTLSGGQRPGNSRARRDIQLKQQSYAKFGLKWWCCDRCRRHPL